MLSELPLQAGGNLVEWRGKKKEWVICKQEGVELMPSPLGRGDREAVGEVPHRALQYREFLWETSSVIACGDATFPRGAMS